MMFYEKDQEHCVKLYWRYFSKLANVSHLNHQAEAFKANVIYPNKQTTQYGKMYQGHLLESETYVGGYVEAIESGVFRADLPEKFKLDPAIFEQVSFCRVCNSFLADRKSTRLNSSHPSIS